MWGVSVKAIRLPPCVGLGIGDVRSILGISSELAESLMLTIGQFNVGRCRRDMVILSDGLANWTRGRVFPAFVPHGEWGQVCDSVYFVGCNSDRVKIGFSKRVTGRLANLGTSSPYELTLIGVMRGGMWLERALHHWFDEHRVNGEWFRREGALAELLEKAPQ